MTELSEIKSQVDKIAKSLERMEIAILGDERAGIKGLVKIVDGHGKDIHSYKNDRTKVIAGAITAGAIFGWLTSFFNSHR